MDLSLSLFLFTLATKGRVQEMMLQALKLAVKYLYSDVGRSSSTCCRTKVSL